MVGDAMNVLEQLSRETARVAALKGLERWRE
jgi:hypothetical protein